MPNLTILFAVTFLICNTLYCAPKKEPKMQSSESSNMSFQSLILPEYTATQNDTLDNGNMEMDTSPPSLYWIKRSAGLTKFNPHIKLSTKSNEQPDFKKNDMLFFSLGGQGELGNSMVLDSIQNKGKSIHFFFSVKLPSGRLPKSGKIHDPDLAILVPKMQSNVKLKMVFNGKEISFQQFDLE